MLPILACSLAIVLTAPVARPDVGFHFLHITDTHVTATGHTHPIKQLLAGIAAHPDTAAFVINTGDLTELGTDAEFAAYTAAIAGSTVPIHCVPGNHDVRWAPRGKEAFRSSIGPTYHSFDYGRCHFVMLDSTVLLEHWGHFDAAQLAWLRTDLKRLKAGTPVFVAFHQWFGMAGANIDNGAELMDILHPHNVIAMFIGHGHSLRQWSVNGIPCFMTRGLYQGNYTDVEVSGDEAIVRRVTVAPLPAATQEVARLSLAPHARLRAELAWEDPNLPLLERRRFSVRPFLPRSTDSAPVKVTFSVNGAAPTELMRPTDAATSDPWLGQFETGKLRDGSNQLLVTVRRGDEAWQGTLPFTVERLQGRPKLSWRADTGDPIQSSATVQDGIAYVSSLDKCVYAFDASNGNRKWRRETGGGLFGSPCVADGVVYVGSMDGFLYAMEAANGRIVWRADTGSPLFATPAVSGKVVCIGANGRIAGFDRATGREAWTVKTRGFYQSRAAEANGVFYLGGWGNAVHAIDAATGAVRWTVEMGRSNGGRGGISFYYSPAITSPVIGGQRLFICTNDGVLHAMDAATGTEAWTARAPANSDGFGYSSPCYADNTVYLGGLGEAGRGNCYAVDAGTGAIKWKCSTGHDNYDSGCTVVGNFVVIGSVDGTVTWVDRATGTPRFSYSLPSGYCFSTAAASGRLVVMPSMSASVFAVEMP